MYPYLILRAESRDPQRRKKKNTKKQNPVTRHSWHVKALNPLDSCPLFFFTSLFLPASPATPTLSNCHILINLTIFETIHGNYLILESLHKYSMHKSVLTNKICLTGNLKIKRDVWVLFFFTKLIVFNKVFNFSDNLEPKNPLNEIEFFVCIACS